MSIFEHLSPKLLPIKLGPQLGIRSFVLLLWFLILAIVFMFSLLCSLIFLSLFGEYFVILLVVGSSSPYGLFNIEVLYHGVVEGVVNTLMSGVFVVLVLKLVMQGSVQWVM